MEDLFDPPSSPLGLSIQAFESWVDTQRSAGAVNYQTTVTMYRAMWNAFVSWSVASPSRPSALDVSMEDLEAFLMSRAGEGGPATDLSPRYVWRFLHLVDRVLAHAATAFGTKKNESAAQLMAARADIRHANAARANPLPDYLSAEEARRLVTYLSEVRARVVAPVQARTWQQVRNAASVALQLGAGLSPGDLRAALLEGVVTEGGRHKEVPWKITVTANGNSPTRETPSAHWAGQLLRTWMRTRRDMHMPGPWLFPSTATGKPWGKVAQYEAAKKVLREAGLDEADGGSFRLRHTFALRQLKRGRSDADVARWMGIADISSLQKYRKIVHAPEDLV